MINRGAAVKFCLYYSPNSVLNLKAILRRCYNDRNGLHMIYESQVLGLCAHVLYELIMK